MPILNQKTGEPLLIDPDHLPTLSMVTDIKDLLADEQITIKDVYTIVNLYTTKTQNTELSVNKYFYEKEALLLMVEEFCEFEANATEINKLYLLALYIEYVIGYRMTKGVPISKDLNSKLAILKEYMQEDNHDNLPTIYDTFIDAITIFTNNNSSSNTHSNSDLSIYTKKISDILNEAYTHPLFHTLKGYYMLYTSKVENAQFLFDKHKNVISSVGSAVCKIMGSKDTNIKDIVKDHSKYNDMKRYVNVMRGYTLMKNSEMNCMENGKGVLRANGVTMFDSNVTMESLICEIDILTDIIIYLYTNIQANTNNKLIDNLTYVCDSLVGTLQDLQTRYNSVSFTSDLNYYIGKTYHARKDYCSARLYYGKSGHGNAQYNYMRIAREIKGDDEKMDGVLNYIHMVNMEYEKINVSVHESKDLNSKDNESKNLESKDNESKDLVLNSNISNNIKDDLKNDKNMYGIYRAVKDEKVPVSAVLSYFNLLDHSGVERRTIVNNLAFFYYKVVEENDTYVISKLYESVKKYKRRNRIKTYDDENVKSHLLDDRKAISDPNSQHMYYINKFIAHELSKFDDDVSKYNLSVYLKKDASVDMLKSIDDRKSYVDVRIGILQNDLEMFKDLIGVDVQAGYVFMGYYHITNRNTRHAVENFKNQIKHHEQQIYVHQYRRDKKKESLDLAYAILEKCLRSNIHSHYLAIYMAIILYERRDYMNVINILKEVSKDVARSKSRETRKIRNAVRKMMGLAYLFMRNNECAMEMLSECGDKEFICRIGEGVSGEMEKVLYGGYKDEEIQAVKRKIKESDSNKK